MWSSFERISTTESDNADIMGIINGKGDSQLVINVNTRSIDCS